MAARWSVTVDIFEEEIGDEYPVIRHIFYGKTKEEALGYYKSHLETDEFLDACTVDKQWEQVKCRTTKLKIERLD